MASSLGIRWSIAIEVLELIDNPYFTTIENLKELIRREDNQHLRNAYDSVAFEKYMKKEWEKRQHQEAEKKRLENQK